MDHEAITAAANRRIDEIVASAEAERGRGMWTLFVREIRRFWQVAGQTIVSPVITTMLYFLVFGYSLGDRLKEVQGIPYVDFLVPGLVMLAVINNAYINAAFSLFIGKIHGSLQDVLVSPLTYRQFLGAYVAAAMVRAMLVGTIIWVVAILMGASLPYSVPLTVIFMLLTALTFSLVGLCVAIVADEFDQVNLLPSFLITPLTFLGGVFYSVEMLPAPWQSVSYFNPILYMVNGLRYGMTGISDVPWQAGLAMLLSLSAIFGYTAQQLLKSGYKLRD
jgi:ABC-2 type transport system permease protein